MIQGNSNEFRSLPTLAVVVGSACLACTTVASKIVKRKGLSHASFKVLLLPSNVVTPNLDLLIRVIYLTLDALL